MSRLAELDKSLSQQLALIDTHPRWRIAAFIAHVGDGEYVFGGLFIVYLIAWWFGYRQVQLGVLAALFSLALSAFAVTSIKYTLRRPRPRDPTGFVSIKYDKYSFPSGHSARMSTLACSIILFNLWLGGILAILAILVALSRVIIAVHYVGDVTVGLLLGSAIGLTVGLIIL